MIKQHHHKGFTLIESLLTLGILLTILTGTYTIFISSNRFYLTQESMVHMHQSTRAAIEFMTRELRDAIIITDLDANSVTFYTDCDDVTAGTSTGGNSNITLNDTKQSWDPDCWKGKNIAITAGAGTPQIRKILSNTGDQLMLSAAWDPNKKVPDNTSFYHLLENKAFVKKDDNILRYTKGGSVNRPFIENITKLNFHQDSYDKRKIDIELTAERSQKDPQVHKQDHCYTLKCTIVIRNERLTF